MIFIFIYDVRENYIGILSLIMICLENGVENLEVVQKTERERHQKA